MEKNRTKALDIMRKDVVALAAEDTIERALEVFEEQRIGGAPVVDRLDNLIGVLTLSDVTKTEHFSDGRIAIRRRGYEMSEPVGEESVDELDPDEIFFVKEDYSAEVVDTDRVADWMTPKVISVAPDAAIEEVCRVMIEEHIHRVFVAEKGKLLGVISSFDVVRHVARAAARRGPAARSAPVQRRALAARRPAAPRARS